MAEVTSPPDTAPARPARRDYATLAGLFGLVHAGYWLAGVRFDRTTLIEVMHFLDPELLRTDLLRSLWHLHIQPPLFNLYTGLVLKATPEAAWLFHAGHLVAGFTLYACVFALQRRLGVGRRLALATATVFMASPSFLLWEHILLYTLPCAALVALGAVLLARALESGRTGPWAAFFWCMAALAGVRAMFHLGYVLLLTAGAVAAQPGRARRIALAAALPLLAVAAMYGKNWLLFGEFSVSTFSPKNLWIMTVGNMNGAQKVRWVGEGRLSPLALINRWESMEAYPPEFAALPARFAEAPALAAVHKSTGAVNYNHYGLIAVAKVYGADARHALRHDPWSYCVAVMQSAYRYFTASHALPVSPHNQQHIGRVMAAYDYGLYGKIPDAIAFRFEPFRQGGHAPRLALLLGLPLVWAYGVWRVVAPGTPRAIRAVLAYMTFTILVVFALGCALDFLETARYRFMTDGLSVALLGLLLHDVAARRRARGRA